MRLGLEARWLTAGPESGRVVLQGLTAALARLAQQDSLELVLYVDARAEDAVRRRFASRPHVAVRGLWFRNRWLTIAALLGRAADRDDVDVLVTQAFSPWRTRARRIVYVHDILFESHPQFFTTIERLYFRRVKPSCRRADRLVAVSAFTRDQLVRYGYAPPEKIAVIHSGCAEDEEEPRHDSPGGYPLPPRYFLYLGRLNDRKNIGTLLQAAERVLPEIDAHLVLIGRPDGRFSRALAEPPAALRRRVHFLGYVDHAELGPIYRRALALVYVPFVEGFGLPVLEAMRHGVPVIASDTSGIREALGDAGWAVDPGAPADIAAAMRTLAENPDRRLELARRGRRHAGEFTWERAARSLLEVCRDALEGAGRTGGESVGR